MLRSSSRLDCYDRHVTWDGFTILCSDKVGSITWHFTQHIALKYFHIMFNELYLWRDKFLEVVAEV